MMSWPQAPTLSLALNADAEQQQQQWTNRVTSCCGVPHEVCKLELIGVAVTEEPSKDNDPITTHPPNFRWTLPLASSENFAALNGQPLLVSDATIAANAF